MPRYILKIHDDKFDKDYYLEWSTVVDAPVTRGMSLNEFKGYYLFGHGQYSIYELEDRLRRVEEKGTSEYLVEDSSHYFEYNRAGPGETSISKEEILDQYCRP